MIKKNYEFGCDTNFINFAQKMDDQGIREIYININQIQIIQV